MRGVQIDDFRRRRLSRRRVCITYRVDFAYNLDDVLFIRQGRDGRQFTDITTLQACDDGYEVDDVLRPVRRIFLVLGQQQLRGDVRRLGLPSPPVVAGEPPPAAPLALVELRERVEPAALLAEALHLAADDGLGGLAVRLADLVPPVVVLGCGEIRAALVHLAHRVAPGGGAPVGATSASVCAGAGPWRSGPDALGRPGGLLLRRRPRGRRRRGGGDGGGRAGVHRQRRRLLPQAQLQAQLACRVGGCRRRVVVVLVVVLVVAGAEAERVGGGPGGEVAAVPVPHPGVPVRVAGGGG